MEEPSCVAFLTGYSQLKRSDMVGLELSGGREKHWQEEWRKRRGQASVDYRQ